MKRENTKKLLNFLFLIIVFGLTVYTVFKGENPAQIFDYLNDADLFEIFLAVLCVVGFILGESVVIYYLIRTLGEKVRFSHCCLYSFVGFFYSCITPSASGGQPMQVVVMRKDKIPVAVSTVVLAIVTITYKLVLVVIGAVVLLIRPQSIMCYLEDVLFWVYLGLVLNVICIAGLLLLVFHPGIAKTVMEWIFALLERIRLFRNPEKQRGRLERIMEQYNGTAEYYRTHKMVIAQVFIITLLQRGLLFLVTWLTYRAFHLEGHGVITIVLLQAMISVAVDMLPLPGGMGISENLFLQIFEPVFGAALVLPGMIIGRGIGYYTQLLLSGIMTVVASVKVKNVQEIGGRME